MYSGFVLFCENTTLAKCVSKRLYTCNAQGEGAAETIKRGSVLFMYNPETRNLVGPFTAASEGATRIETGAWTSKIDEHTPSADIKLEWENLHIIPNADIRFPFLNKSERCELPALTVQTLLDALKNAPEFKG